MSQGTSTWWQAAVRAAAAGSGIVGASLVGALAGDWADRHWPGLAPWGLIAGVGAGLLLGVWYALREAKKV